MNQLIEIIKFLTIFLLIPLFIFPSWFMTGTTGGNLGEVVNKYIFVLYIILTIYIWYLLLFYEQYFLVCIWFFIHPILIFFFCFIIEILDQYF